MFKLAEAYRPGQPAPEVTIEQAAIMKLLADLYLQGALDREGVRRMAIERAKAEPHPEAASSPAPAEESPSSAV